MDGNASPVLVAAGVVAVAAVVFAQAGCHTVPEGHVGAYWRSGRLLQEVSAPGMHFNVPGITYWEPIQVTMQTDKVRNVPCGTKGGSLIHFEQLEVVNRLRKEAVYDILSEYGTQYDRTWIYDKLHHEMNQFCSAHSLQEVYIDKFSEIDEIMQKALQDSCRVYAPGIDIIAVRVTKPRLPEAVHKNFEAMEEQRTKAMVAQQTQGLVKIEAETLKQKELAETEISIRKQVLEMEAKLKVTRIENTIKVETERAQTDAESYRLQQQARGNEKLHTKEYLSLQWASAFNGSTTLYFGPALGGMTSAVAKAATQLFAGGQGES